MSTIKERILAIFAEDEKPTEPITPPVTPPVNITPPVTPPPVEPTQPQVPDIEALLAKQKAELEASFADKLKNLKSDSTPPPPIEPTPEPVKSGVDIDDWNKRIEAINKRNNITHLN